MMMNDLTMIATFWGLDRGAFQVTRNAWRIYDITGQSTTKPSDSSGRQVCDVERWKNKSQVSISGRQMKALCDIDICFWSN